MAWKGIEAKAQIGVAAKMHSIIHSDKSAAAHLEQCRKLSLLMHFQRFRNCVTLLAVTFKSAIAPSFWIDTREILSNHGAPRKGYGCVNQKRVCVLFKTKIKSNKNIWDQHARICLQTSSKSTNVLKQNNIWTKILQIKCPKMRKRANHEIAFQRMDEI